MKANLNNLVIFLIYVQSILLGWANIYSSIVELTLLSVLAIYFFMKGISSNGERKYLGVVFLGISLVQSIVCIAAGGMDIQRLILIKNIFIYITVSIFVMSEKIYAYSMFESWLFSIIIFFPLLGFIIPELTLNVKGLSSLQNDVAADIFGPGGLGLNVHFTTQIILSNILLFNSHNKSLADINSK